MSTAVTWLALVGLAVVAVTIGRLDVALLCAAVKAVLVGLEFMELRAAARLHAVGFALAVAALTATLLLMLAGV